MLSKMAMSSFSSSMFQGGEKCKAIPTPLAYKGLVLVLAFYLQSTLLHECLGKLCKVRWVDS